MLRTSPANPRVIATIVIALLCWGIYLAIGATGMFVQESMLDVRKSAIVLICVLLFLGLWSLVLGKRIRGTAKENPGSTWSKAGFVSLGSSMLGCLVWLLSIITWQSVATSTTTVLGWLVAVSMVGAATFGIIALSDRFIRRGKWFGAAGLLVSLSSLIVFIIRMSPR